MPVPVISVGNLTLGGTGKTPIVCHLAAFLQQQGYKPAIISRGYGGVVGEKVNIVSDGKNILLSATQAGDEPVMMAARLSGIPVLTGIVRALPCQYAVRKFGCDILILDDGFQHLAVKRDINLVLFDGTTLAGNSRIFPGGDLREPVKALNRADIFVLTSVNQDNQERVDKFTHLLQDRFPHIPTTTTGYSYQHLQYQQQVIEPTKLPSPLYAFCGIANPHRFFNTLKNEDIPIVGQQMLNDHQPYTDKILAKINNKARKKGAKALITTEKDYTKLAHLQCTLPIYTLCMSVNNTDKLDEFIDQRLLATLKNHPPNSR
jgi:tetraacyldisaccharide 4'-kinase